MSAAKRPDSSFLLRDSILFGRCLRPGYPLILLQALTTGPVSAATPNAGCHVEPVETSSVRPAHILQQAQD